METLLFGALAALCWGTADFAARFSGRAVGPAAALFGVMATGAAALWLWTGQVPETPSWWAVGHGAAGLGGLLLLYEGLRRGRVTTVVPLAGAFPAWSLAALVVFDGVRPGPWSWLAMALVMGGVWMVARFAQAGNHPGGDAGGKILAVALGSGALMGLSLYLAQHATPIHGEAGTLLIARGMGMLVLALPVLLRAKAGAIRTGLRWTPLLVVQGLLDTFGFLALLLAGAGEEAAEATVVSSTFGLVTIALARLVLREPVAPRQWMGIALTFGGVALLASVG